jgi:hypothetical protein
MKLRYPGATAFRVILSFITLCPSASLYSQQVSGIVTDYKGYWKSSLSSLNAVKPDNSHNLLAFTYNNVQYSTGANDPLLISHGETFMSGDFWALPVDAISGSANGNTKLGWGEMKDGVHNGSGTSVKPQMNLSTYLTDGTKGLDLGTCVANLPAGTLTFFVNNIRPQNIGDGIPDILVTQIADPSGSTDRYSFTDAAGNIIGAKMNIAFNNITPIGNWTADFYEAQGATPTLTSGFTNTDRPLRLWAADLSDFGITAANYTAIKKFKVDLSGNSDIAFAAYNNRTLNLASPLPVLLSSFEGKLTNNTALLNWTTATELQFKSFVIERSTNNSDFSPIGEVAAAGNSTSVKKYNFSDKNLPAGIVYYRLKLVDEDGSSKYSTVIRLGQKPDAVFSVYPNPGAGNHISFTIPAQQGAQVKLFSANGSLMVQLVTNESGHAEANIEKLPKGIYYAVWQHAGEKLSTSFLRL